MRRKQRKVASTKYKTRPLSPKTQNDEMAVEDSGNFVTFTPSSEFDVHVEPSYRSAAELDRDL